MLSYFYRNVQSVGGSCPISPLLVTGLHRCWCRSRTTIGLKNQSSVGELGEKTTILVYCRIRVATLKKTNFYFLTRNHTCQSINYTPSISLLITYNTGTYCNAGGKYLLYRTRYAPSVRSRGTGVLRSLKLQYYVAATYIT
jgi:hypothetical protein